MSKKKAIPQGTTEDQVAAVGVPKEYEPQPASDPEPEPEPPSGDD